jgi:amidase
MDDLLKRDATDQLAALNAKRVSAVELLKSELARHEKTHGTINAVVAVSLERALEHAAAIDDLRARGEALGLLAGLPMTVKDTLDVVGLPASSGLKHLKARQAEDASAVKAAKHAGAVIWGKTNTPVMAGDWQTFNGLYGTTNNPWDQQRTTGGSSGGAAAALAAGVTALEIGSDIGGSLRVPASFCGVYSHKPTWGLVEQHGHVPPAPGSWSERDLNVIGPMARSARDLRLLLYVLEDGMLAPRAPPAELKEARIALWLDEASFPLDPEVRATIESFATELSAAGVEATPIASPAHMPTLVGAYQVLLGGVLGEDMPASTLRAMERMRPFARWQMARGAAPTSGAAMAMAYTATHREWMAADAVRARLRHEIGGVFDRFDAIVAPIAPVAAFPHDHRPFTRRRLTASDGGTMPYAAMLNWIALPTALHLPATAIPAGSTAAGLPVGAQLIGPLHGDARLLALAQAIEENVRGFIPPEMAR